MTDRVRMTTVAVVGVLCGAIGAGCGGGSSTIITHVPSARKEARTTLYRAAGSRRGELRAQAIESLAVAVGDEAGETFARALDDEAEAVQFVAAMAIGDVAYAPAAGKLSQMAAAADTDPNVLCGVIYALHSLGDDSHMSKLGKLLYDRSPQVRANAALVMGKMGLSAAIRPLNSRLVMEQESPVRLQLAESLASLGDQRSYGVLRNYAGIGKPYERLAAIQALGRTRSLRARGDVLGAIGSQQPPPLRLVAVGALAQMGDYRGYGLAVEAVRNPKKFTQRSFDEPVRVSAAQQQQMQSLAAMALGEMNRPEAVDILVGLMDSPNPTVRVSAARSILILLKHYTPPAMPPAPQGPAAQPSGADAAPAPETSDQADEPVLRTAPPKD